MHRIILIGLCALIASFLVCDLHAQALTVNTVAGNGVPGFSGDGGAATAASLFGPMAVAADAAGNFYIADTFNNRIRKVSVGGVITTFAGNGTAGFSGDGDVASNAQLNAPVGVAVDSTGTFLYIADQVNNRIRKVNLTIGVISTAAGSGGTDFNGDGPALSTSIGSPASVAVDAAGNVYFSVPAENRIKRLSADGVFVQTVAGTGTAGFSGDGGAPLFAQFNSPANVAADSSGNVYVADTGNARIRKMSLGLITTVAGNGLTTSSGDGVSAVSASIGSPWGVAVDSAGNIFFTTTNFPTVRKVTAGGSISTVAGNGSFGFSGDGGLALLAQFGTRMGIIADASGNIYLADQISQRVRKLFSVSATRIGSFAQVASGGGWKTTLVLINLSGGSVDAQVLFYDNNGAALTLPLTFPLSTGSTVTNASSASVTVPPNSTVIIESAATTATIAVGWADVQANGPLSGYTIFRDGSHNSEGTVLLDNGAASLTIPFDNRNSGRTAFALANQGAATTVNVTVLDNTGSQIGSGSINLNGSSHFSDFIDNLVAASANKVGLIKLQTSNSLIVGIGLRFNSTGSFTSAPVIR